MRFAWAALVAGLLAGCTGGLAERQAELAQWVGQPEAQLVAAMGAPRLTNDSGAMKLLTYREVRIERQPSGDFYFGPGPAAPTGFWDGTTALVCDTTFAVSGGVVRGFSLRGNGCG
jgi:hypothetical protein